MLVEIASAADVEEGLPVLATARGRDILVVRWRDRFYAIRNICPHTSAAFSISNRVRERNRAPVHDLVTGADTMGDLTVRSQEPVIVCPWHTWEFRLSDGGCVVDPTLRVKSYRVVVERDKIFIEMGPNKEREQGPVEAPSAGTGQRPISS